MEPTHKVHQASPTSRQKAVMEKLSALQNSHRLAIHMVEHNGCNFQMHKGLMRQLKKGDRDDVVKELLEYAGSDDRVHYPLHSVSLLPPDDSGWSMHPFALDEDTLNNFGYLFNVSQEQSNPPLILSADCSSLVSGSDESRKLRQIDAPEYDATRKVYDAILERHPPTHRGETENKRITDNKRLVMAMCGPNRTEYANKMLDALHSEPLWEGFEFRNKFPQTSAENEVIAALGTRHIAAITVPVFQSPESEDKTYLAFRKLQASLVGLNHLKSGIDVPVVLYHVTPPNKGGLSYVGQGKEELRRVGLEALKQIGDITAISEHSDFDFKSCTKPYGTDQLTKHVQANLGVDISAEQNGSTGWRTQVNDQLASIKASSRLQATPSPDLPPN